MLQAQHLDIRALKSHSAFLGRVLAGATLGAMSHRAGLVLVAYDVLGIKKLAPLLRLLVDRVWQPV